MPSEDKPMVSPPSIDPLPLLYAHHSARDRGCRVTSVLVGDRVRARALWSTSLFSKQSERGGGARIVIPAGVDLDAVAAALRFAQGSTHSARRPVPLLLAPDDDQFAVAFRTLRALAEEQATRPAAVLVKPAELFSACKRQTENSAMRSALIGGLVVFDQHVESMLNRHVLTVDERPLYGSNQLGRFLRCVESGFDSRLMFEVGRRVRGRSGVSYQVDIACVSLRFGVQIVHAQALSSPVQQQRHRDLIADLGDAGFSVLQFSAFEVLSDPAWVVGEISAHVKRLRESA